MGRYYDDWGYAPYVRVAERRRQAAREMEKLRKKGHPVSPVVIEGRTLLPRPPHGPHGVDQIAQFARRRVRPRHAEAPLHMRLHLRSQPEDKAPAGGVG